VRQILFGIPILLAALVAGARPGLPRAEPDPASLRFARVMDPVLLADSSDSNGTAWVDVDNDGDEDLFVTGGGGAYNLLYRNDGAAGFSRVLAGELVNIRQQHLGTSWADYNNDGRLDVFLANGVSRIGSLIYRGSPTGDFLRTEGWIVPNEVVLHWSGAWGDYDNDGFVDLAAVHAFGFLGPSGPNGLWHNNGDGTFTRVVNSPIVTAPPGPYTVGSWIDFDQDGDLDFFIGAGPANGTIAPDAIYRNLLADSGRAVFRRVTDLPMATDSLDGQHWNFVDIDNDGDLDGYVTNYTGRTNGMANHLYRNTGGTFARDTTAGALVTDRDVSLGNLWGDFDNDGDLDVVVTNGGRGGARVRFYRNDGRGHFISDTTVGALVAPDAPAWGSTAADYDNDGDLDLFLSVKSPPQARAPDRLFRNELAPGNHWLNLKLVGTGANRAGIGARVRVTAVIGGGRVTQTRVISSQDTFNGHNSLRVHLGLGDAATAERVEITWPGGARDEYRGVGANRFLLATEGAATLGEQALPARDGAGR
jgi:hypothetical protein